MEQILMREAQRWIAPRAAWLEARDGVIWVTRAGDLEDHVLRRGDRLAVARGDDLVLQSWRRDRPAAWDWQARELRTAVLPAWAWGAAAALLRTAGAALDALAARAGRAATRASRAPG